MYSFESVLPVNVSRSVVERFFVGQGQLAEGVVLKDKPLPSIMQSLIIDFGGTPQKAVLPDGTSFNCEGDLIMGQFTKRYTSTISGQLNAIGIQLSPTGLYRLFRLPMTNFANSIRYLKDYAYWHPAMRIDLEKAGIIEERIRIMENYLAQHLLNERSASLEAIEEAAKIIRETHGSKTLNEIGKTIGMSERTLQRYFSFYVGVSPKAFMRIARFNTVTKMIEENEEINWQEILLATGYFDAAHFTHDFKSITGKTPSEYYKGKSHYEKFFYGN